MQLFNKQKQNNTAPIALTPVQTAAFNAVVGFLENEFTLPAEARAFWPLVKVKLQENLARTDEETIMGAIEKLLDRGEQVLLECYNASESKKAHAEAGLIESSGETA